MKTPLDLAINPAWGIGFPRPVAAGSGLKIVNAGIPATVTIALNQHVGTPAQPCVVVGEQVECGQPIARMGPHRLGSNIHASTSGTVIAIEPVELPGERQTLAIRIASDGKDTRWSGYQAITNPLDQTPVSLRQSIIDAGIVGLGGAMFPAGIKLNPGSGIDTLILNGVECEPQMNCDDALMRQSARAILMGAQVMLRILEADECLVALKQPTGAKTPSPAHACMQQALDGLDDDRIRIIPVPSIYPIGGEAQLIQVLTGREIPSGGLPWDTGVACQNVGTAAAITEFFATGQPLIERMTTVTGGGVKHPVNVIARIGTSAAELIACAGGYRDSASRLIFGGPMMGVAASDDAVPIRKSTNCLYVASSEELGNNTTPMPCIRCGDCAVACPVSLTPQLMLEAKRGHDLAELEQLGIMDCIECGCCDYVCPSHIALTPGFKASKRDIWRARSAQRIAAKAEQHFAARTARLASESTQQLDQLSAQVEQFQDDAGARTIAELRDRITQRQNNERGPKS